MKTLDERMDDVISDIIQRARMMIEQSKSITDPSLDKDKLVLYNKAVGMADAAIEMNKLLCRWIQEEVGNG